MRNKQQGQELAPESLAEAAKDERQLLCADRCLWCPNLSVLGTVCARSHPRSTLHWLYNSNAPDVAIGVFAQPL